MAKWLLHSYLQVALNVHSARIPSQDFLKLFVRLGNSEIMFSFVEGKTVWRIIGESVEDVLLFREGNTQRIENRG